MISDHNSEVFPNIGDIRLSCSCRKKSKLCYHLAAGFYSIGSLLDNSPELLFLLRGVDHKELLEQKYVNTVIKHTTSCQHDSTINSEDLSEIFGIEFG
ncbi:MAG TPA: hypothetical protein VJK54_07860 [Chthoniobacterales bacterium]|nr:hypothetical protein [Chthoniobacterales bacterium]